MSARNPSDASRDPARDRHDGARRRTVHTAADVLGMLAEATEHVLADPDLDPVRKARALAQLARAELDAIKLDTLEARVAAVEATLKLRQVQQALEDKR